MAVTEAGRRELFAKQMTEEFGVTIDETIGGLALIVLGILALADINPLLLNSIATIVAGVALLVVSAGLGIELSRALTETTRHALNVNEAGAGLNAGVLGGITGIVLGILALLGVARPELVAIALIVFGGSVLFDYMATVQVRALKMMAGERAEHPSRLAVSVASSTNMGTMMAGIALITLGILALSGIAGSSILVSVALLGLGAYLFLEASAVVSRMMFQVAR
jgi:hypothetical protein